MQHRRRDHRCTSSPVAPNIIFSGREWTQVVYLHLPNAARYLFKHVFLLFSVPAVLARARVRQHRKHCMSRVPMPRSRDTDFEWLIATRLFPCKCVYTFAFRDIDLHHYNTFEFGQTVNTRLYVFLVMFVSQTAICSHIAADLADTRQGVSPSSSHCACTFRCRYIYAHTFPLFYRDTFSEWISVHTKLMHCGFFAARKYLEAAVRQSTTSTA